MFQKLEPTNDILAWQITYTINCRHKAFHELPNIDIMSASKCSTSSALTNMQKSPARSINVKISESYVWNSEDSASSSIRRWNVELPQYFPASVGEIISLTV